MDDIYVFLVSVKDSGVPPRQDDDSNQPWAITNSPGKMPGEFFYMPSNTRKIFDDQWKNASILMESGDFS